MTVGTLIILIVGALALVLIPSEPKPRRTGRLVRIPVRFEPEASPERIRVRKYRS